MKNICAGDVTDSMPLFRKGRGGSIPTSAHQLLVSVCSVHRAIELNELWHSRLPILDWTAVVRTGAHICFLAEHDDVAYASAVWSSPCARAFNGRGWLELRRLAISDNAPKNTATRMLRVMRLIIVKRMPDVTRLISYQDTEVHAGTIYKAAGWTAHESGKDTWKRPNRTRTDKQKVGKKIRWEYVIVNKETGATEFRWKECK